MGFLDKIRTLKNAVTGGGAEVSLDVQPARPGESFEVIVRARIGEDDLDVDRVYVRIRGTETIEIPGIDVVYETGDDEERRPETVTAESDTLSHEVEVAGKQTLAANQEYEWKVEAELPADALPGYRGKHCNHGYRVIASLDCFGNDPDSGWVELEVA